MYHQPSWTIWELTHNMSRTSIQLMVRREEMAPLPPRYARLRLIPDHWWTSREGPWRGLHLHSSMTGHRLPRSNMEDPWANLSLAACPRNRVRFRLLICVFKVKILLTNTQWLKYIVRVIYAWFTVMTISVSMRVPFQNKTCQDIVPTFLFRKSHHSFITLSKCSKDSTGQSLEGNAAASMTYPIVDAPMLTFIFFHDDMVDLPLS